MLKKIESSKMGRASMGWLEALYHFSFANYYNPENFHFGVLRVLNDDIIAANTGFDTHPHKDMEIITYVVDGKLTHEDSMGNKSSISRGQVQYMSAGTGIFHSEHNKENEAIRSLQIWVLPDRKGHTPNYGDYKFQWDLRKNNWLHMVSGKGGDAPIKINQDVNFYVLELDKNKEIDFIVNNNRKAYLVQIEGSSEINKLVLMAKDALEITEEDIIIKARENSHFIIIEMSS